jgi:hypothetical protein
MSSHTMTEKPFLRNCCTPGRSEQMPKTPGRDGIIHIVMSPLEIMQRLATLAPFVRDRPQPAGHERRLGGPPFVPRSKLYEPHGQGRFTIGPRIPFRHVRQRRVRASTPAERFGRARPKPARCRRELARSAHVHVIARTAGIETRFSSLTWQAALVS